VVKLYNAQWLRVRLNKLIKIEANVCVGWKYLSMTQNLIDERMADNDVTAVEKIMGGRLSVGFVIRHFIVIFTVSFILGVLFLHYSVTFWQWTLGEDSIMDILNTAVEPDEYGLKRILHAKPNGSMQTVFSR